MALREILRQLDIYLNSTPIASTISSYKSPLRSRFRFPCESDGLRICLVIAFEPFLSAAKDLSSRNERSSYERIHEPQCCEEDRFLYYDCPEEMVML